jgi:hypothetical protein
MIENLILVCFLALLPLQTGTCSQPSIGPSRCEYSAVESTGIVYPSNAVRVDTMMFRRQIWAFLARTP